MKSEISRIMKGNLTETRIVGHVWAGRIVTGNAGESCRRSGVRRALTSCLVVVEPNILDGATHSSRAHRTLQNVSSHFSYCQELYLNFTA